ncbi:retrovirus-related pol polyprotein from transposon TNT 1-94 [Tanacetum coccineum]
MGTIHFGNDHFAAITGYRDYVQGNLTIYHVYYVEGLGHNWFSIGQFCDGDLEVAFRSNTCYLWNLKGDDLLTGSRDSNLNTISISEMVASSPVCLMSRATSTKSCKTASLPPKLVPSTESKLELLHMDLCGPMKVASINGKKYILVIVDDYSRFTWNCSIVHTRYNKTPYELIHGRKPNVQYFHVFGSLCYPTNDRDDLRKMKPKADNDNRWSMYEEYYPMSSQEVSDNSTANTLDNDHTSSSSLIVVDQDDAPQIVSSLEDQVVTEPNSAVLNEVADEFVQEDVADFDRPMFHNAPQTPEFDVAESSSTYQDPSNMHQFH